MKIKLIRKSEHWRDCGQVQSVIDDAEQAVGFNANSYEPYHEAIDDFADDIVLRLEDAGHSVEWESQQSVGVGGIVQGPWLKSAYGTGGIGDRKLADDAYSVAFDAARPEFFAMCKTICEGEQEHDAEREAEDDD